MRVDNNNRHHNTMTDGLPNAEKMYRCIVGDCMSWRQYHRSHFKGSDEGLQSHGYCGFAGKPDLDQGFRRPAVRNLGLIASPPRRRSDGPDVDPLIAAEYRLPAMGFHYRAICKPALDRACKCLHNPGCGEV